MLFSYFKRFCHLTLGLFIVSIGCYFSIQANVGLAPWDAFSMGLSYKTGLSYGDIMALSGLLIIIFDILMKEKVGFGTFMNAVIIGHFTDLHLHLNWLPQMNSFILGVLMLFVGQFILAYGTYYYIKPGLGAGPRDGLMVGLAKRLPKVPIGIIRGSIEACALFIGWICGAKVGIGTVIAVFGISFILQFTFRLIKFDVKSVRHENIADTLHQWFPIKK